MTTPTATTPNVVQPTAVVDQPYLAKTEPIIEEIANDQTSQDTAAYRTAQQSATTALGSPTSSSPVVTQQSVIQSSPSIENSITQGSQHQQTSPAVPLTPEAPTVSV